VVVSTKSSYKSGCFITMHRWLSMCKTFWLNSLIYFRDSTLCTNQHSKFYSV
jgi:hypothetical protein